MNESAQAGKPASPMAEAPDHLGEIAALRTQSADRLDPVRFHYLEALARRLPSQRGDVRRILDARLADELTAYRARFQQTRAAADATARRMSEQYPDAAGELQRHLRAGDLRGLRRSVERLERDRLRASLSELTRHINRSLPENGGTGPDAIGSGTELKAIRVFRNTWAKLSVEKQVTKAIEQGPENPGPLNSHMLVLRSLALMRDISPGYLKHFMSYVDALLWLDQSDRKSRPPPKKARPAKTPRK